MNKLIFILTFTLQFLATDAAFAADDLSSTGMVYLTVKMISVLALVLGLIFLCLNLMKKYMPRGNMLFPEKKCMRIVESLYFDSKKSVVLLKVASEYVLVGVSPTEINYLKEINMTDPDKSRLSNVKTLDGCSENSIEKGIKIQSLFRKLHLIKND